MNKITERIIISRKNVVIFLIIAASLLIAAVMLCSNPGGFGFRETINASEISGREKYLNSFGWEIDVNSEESEEILLPKSFDGVISEYAKMQDEQGFEFSLRAGTECIKYTYIVTNYPNYTGTVYATLYVAGCRVIGGDIHAAELNGFMHGIK